MQAFYSILEANNYGKRQITRLGKIYFLWHTLKNAKNY
jgi:hypothetical protein